MILYKAIKYSILDYCLDVFFEKFGINLANLSNTMKFEDLKEGMILSKILIYDKRGLRTWDSCKIRAIKQGNLFIIIEFDFTFSVVPLLNRFSRRGEKTANIVCATNGTEWTDLNYLYNGQLNANLNELVFIR